MNKFLIKTRLQNIAIACGIAIFFIVDRGLKMFAQHQGPESYFKIIKNIFLFRFTPNPYISFSIPFSGILLNIIIILIILGLILYVFYLILNKKYSHLNPQERKITVIFLTIIIIGAISNILDRLLFGYVIDYLELKHFTVFNIADIMISVGTIIIIIKNLNQKK
jgi:signal peptidase II